MSREINFANVNISIQEFQKLSKGDYNAGEVKLASETRLTKINNHVHRIGANNQKLSHAEVMVIKDAFIKALTANGVGVDEINRVRAEIGLAPTGADDKALTERSCKPLTRQQIRQILDRNAEIINAATGERTIRTGAQLFAGRSENKQARVAQMRDVADAATAEQRGIDTNNDISIYQRTLAGDSEFVSQGERELALRCAKAQRQTILQQSNNAPSADRPCEMSFAMVSGARVQVSAGASEAETLRRLDEQILRLTHSKGPSEAQLAARQTYLAVGSDNTARRMWLQDQGINPKDPLAVRSAVVAELQERGINDFATLSIVNHLNSRTARLMLSTLLITLQHYQGDALRNCQFMGMMRSPANQDAVAEDKQAFIPAFSPAERNAAICDVVTSKDPQRVIPYDLANMARECHTEAVNHFGAELAAVTDSVSGFASDADIQAFCEAESAAGRDISANSLRECYLNSGLKTCADKFVAAEFKTMLQAGQDANTANRLTGLLKKAHPELQKQLIDAGSPAAAREILNGFANEMKGMAERSKVVDSLRNGGLKQMLNECFAEALGLEGLGLTGNCANFETKNTEILAELCDAIESGTHAAKTPDEIRNAFREKATAAVQERAALCAKVDTLGLPSRNADTIKSILMNADSIRGLDLDAIMANLKSMKPYLGAFTGILADGGYENKTVYTTMQSLSGMLKMDGVDNPALKPLMIQLIAAQTPGMTESLDAFFADEEVKADLAAKPISDLKANALPYMAGVAKPENNAAIAESIGRGSMNPLFAQAIIAAVNAAGLADLPAADKFAIFAYGTQNCRQLREAVSALAPNVELQPHLLKTIASGILTTIDKTTLLARAEAYNTYRATVEESALAAGFHKSQISSLCHNFSLLKGATGCSDADALAAVLDSKSDAHRLYGFGGRFIASPENFAKGLRLQGQFKEWFMPTATEAHEKATPNHQLPANASLTLINADPHFFVPKASFAYEKFLFEEIAINEELPLETNDPEQVFGMEHNPATRYIGRAYTTACTNTVAQLPPTIRQTIYKVLDLLVPLARSEREVKDTNFSSSSPQFLGLMLAHIDDLRGMEERGMLTRESVLNLLYSEVPNATFMSVRDIYEWYTNEITTNVLANEFGGDFTVVPKIYTAMVRSGRTLTEAIQAIKAQVILPSVPYYSEATGKIEELDGTWNGGRTQAVMDLVRPYNPSRIGSGNDILTQENCVFTAHFSDGTVMKTARGTKEVRTASANAIADKVEQFVGTSNPAQLNAVLFFLSQSGEGGLLGAFAKYGIDSNEHMALTYSLSKDEATGSIVIHYSQPEGFPLNFHWDTTILPDGSNVTTPMIIEQPAA